LKITPVNSLKLEKKFNKGDEVITFLDGFPTTVNPIALKKFIVVLLTLKPKILFLFKYKKYHHLN
jgi:hypothetical protein